MSYMQNELNFKNRFRELTDEEIGCVGGGLATVSSSPVPTGSTNRQITDSVNKWLSTHNPGYGCHFEPNYTYDDNWNITSVDIEVVSDLNSV